MACSIDPNSFDGSDSQRIAAAIAAAMQNGERTVVIPKRRGADRDFWLIDEAILLPGGLEVILDDCRIKLSDRSRDNFFRSANCELGITDIKVLQDIHLTGKGNAVLEGADHPRSTGDSGKVLGESTYGTDAGKAGESQYGDWRNIGVLFAKVERFSITGLTLRNYHCWGLSMEKCAYGRIADLKFDTQERRIIDGEPCGVLNQDGVDLRKGCHDMTVENISGNTGDDVVAFTAIGTQACPAGSLRSTEVSENVPGVNQDICHVSIRNVCGYSTGGHQIVRILNAGGALIHDVLIENIRDGSAGAPVPVQDRVTLKIGDTNPAWGGVTPLGDTSRLTIRHIDSRSIKAVLVAGSLCDSVIEDVVNRNSDCQPVECTSGPENMRNVVVRNAKTEL